MKKMRGARAAAFVLASSAQPLLTVGTSYATAGSPIFFDTDDVRVDLVPQSSARTRMNLLQSALSVMSL